MPSSWLVGNKKGQYRHHLKELYLEEEKAKIQESAIQLEYVKERIRAAEAGVEELEVLVAQAYETNRKLSQSGIHALGRIQGTIHMYRSDLKRIIKNYKPELEGEREPNMLLWKNEKVKKEKRITFISGCPNEECRGLIESKSYRCNVCEKRICSKCWLSLSEGNSKEHVCNPVTIASMELIKKESKGCPKCGMRICKIAGCNQMWCVECKTPFDYQTGRILSLEHFHNPHAMEWLRNNHIREPLNHCGVINIFHLSNSKHFILIQSIFRTISELNLYRIRGNYNDNLDKQRMSYFLGYLDENKWRNRIFNQKRKKNRHRRKNEIIDMFIQIAQGLFRKVLATKKLKKDIELFLKEIESLRIYYNQISEKEMKMLGQGYYYAILFRKGKSNVVHSKMIAGSTWDIVKTNYSGKMEFIFKR